MKIQIALKMIIRKKIYRNRNLILFELLINMRFYGASFNIVVLCSIKPHIDLVQVQ